MVLTKTELLRLMRRDKAKPAELARLAELAPAVHDYVLGRRARGVPTLGRGWEREVEL